MIHIEGKALDNFNVGENSFIYTLKGEVHALFKDDKERWSEKPFLTWKYSVRTLKASLAWDALISIVRFP